MACNLVVLLFVGCVIVALVLLNFTGGQSQTAENDEFSDLTVETLMQSIEDESQECLRTWLDEFKNVKQ